MSDVAAQKPSKQRSVQQCALSAAAHFFATYTPAHDIPGRLRLRPARNTCGTVDAVQALLLQMPVFAKASVTVSPVTGSILVCYGDPALRQDILHGFGLSSDLCAAVKPAHAQCASATALGPAKEQPKNTPQGSGKKLPQKPAKDQPASQCDLTPSSVRNPLPERMLKVVYPRILANALSIFRAIPYILSGLKNLFFGRLNLEVLDGAALLVCLLRKDFRALGSITFFFALGEYLADWTRRKSRASLEKSLELNIDQVWVRVGDLERQIPFAEVQQGDIVIVRAGSIIPIDGTVQEGDGMVNQASMTGEPLPVHFTAGASVYAGSVLEEGHLAVKASRVGNNTRLNAVLRSIEESESAKASIQGNYEHIADAIVPYNFLLSGLVYAITRDLTRAGSVLLVDYSCAIRLGTPLCIFTAMREAADQGVLIKGGKFVEAAAKADVVIFDKTGTLTEARPVLVDIIAFGTHARDTILRLAACLEEHFAHPVGVAVVRAAEQAGLGHREEHADVEYVVAHGIASHWRKKRVLIGSKHFIMEDEGIAITKAQETAINAEIDKGYSALYLAIGGKIAGVLFIDDKIRENARAVIQALHADGVKRIIMLTGDSERTANSIAARAGIDEVQARLLPADKAAFVEKLKSQGHTVMMVGDGINDSPALSAADVGVAMAEGADLAREVADIVLHNGNLEGILLAREISRLALARVHKNFRASIVYNSIFLIGGLLGILRPGLSAFLHNVGTAAIAVTSIGPLRPKEKQNAAPVKAKTTSAKAKATLPKAKAAPAKAKATTPKAKAAPKIQTTQRKAASGSEK